MVALGTTCPDFSLPDTASGRTVTRSDYAGNPLLVMFICNHCPFVVHVADELARLGRDYGHRLGIVAICSNDEVTHPADGPGPMAEEATRRGYSFPYLHDATQHVARAFDAACTPDFFLYDDRHRLAYRGQLDDSRPGSPEPVTGRDLRTAIDAVLAGSAPAAQQRPSIGCNIKWRA
jgi:thiol-disulfide isomerase/thioredoxin